MASHVHAHEISERKHNNLPVSPMKDFQSWLHRSERTIDRRKWESGKQREWKRWEREKRSDKYKNA